VGLYFGRGMSLSTVSLVYIATTAWVYRDVRDQDIDNATFIEYGVNAAIAVVCAFVFLVVNNGRVQVITDAVAAIVLVSFVVRRGIGERALIERARGSMVAPRPRLRRRLVGWSRRFRSR
jgi:hypothetical protein